MRGSLIALCVLRYAVALNGAESIREALLKKSAHFSDRTKSFLYRYVNPERKGSTNIFISQKSYTSCFDDEGCIDKVVCASALEYAVLGPCGEI